GRVPLQGSTERPQERAVVVLDSGSQHITNFNQRRLHPTHLTRKGNARTSEGSQGLFGTAQWRSDDTTTFDRHYHRLFDSNLVNNAVSAYQSAYQVGNGTCANTNRALSI